MKTSLKSLALLAALTYPCVAFAEFFGARLPSDLDAGTLVGAFSILLLGLISVADYSRRPRSRLARASAGNSAACEIHRLAA